MERPQANADWVREALERHSAALTRYAASITGDVESARDIVQDTFVRLCAADSTEIEGHLAEWLFTVCRNRALDVHRKLQRLSPLSAETLAAMPGDAPDPAVVAEQQDTVGVALGLLGTLSTRQQEVVRLKFQGGLSYEQIGRVMNLSSTNVGFILHTALRTLRERLQRAL